MAEPRAFTLVEILIVVVLLGILAAAVVPQFSNASQQARAGMLKDDLRVLRSQIEVFAAQHRGVPPGYPDCDLMASPTEPDFLAHLTMASDAFGNLAAPGTAGFPYGPYMSRMPPNPVSQLDTVEVLDDGEPIPAAPDGSHGYVYHPASRTLLADSTGADPDGVPYFDY